MVSTPDPPPGSKRSSGNSARAQRVNDLFLSACDLQPAERAKFLILECKGDASMFTEVESLLAFDRPDSATFQKPVLGSDFDLSQIATSAEPAKELPAFIGNYKILSMVGFGSMGVVYRAEQVDPNRHVALKVVQRGMTSEDSLKRFKREAEFLGRLKHPGIAQIYEANSFDNGAGLHPFFAMELVDGVPLNDYVKEHSLSTVERLRLIREICQAIHYAHQRGVIHRDIKPANILVDASGNPKILDFGVACSTNMASQNASLAASGQEIAGTLPYMSQEQLSGRADELDHRADVYSIGVLAYEILAGQLPFDTHERSFAEAARIISEDDATKLGVLNRSYKGDLETIVGKAIEKEPNRRYESAADFSADIQRYLKHEPIEARPPTRLYTFSRFTRRHRGLVAGLITTFVALLAGVIGTSKGLAEAKDQTGLANVAAIKAQKESRLARLAETAARESAAEAKASELLAIQASKVAEQRTEISNRVLMFMINMFDLEEPSTARGKKITVREVLDKAAKEIEFELSSDPEVRAELLAAIGIVLTSLAQYDHAIHLLELALSIRSQDSTADHEGTLRVTAALGLAHLGLGEAEKAEGYLRQVYQQRLSLLGGSHLETLESQSDLGVALIELGLFPEAMEMSKKALDARIRLAAKPEDILASAANVAQLHMRLGNNQLAIEEMSTLVEDFIDHHGDDHPNLVKVLVNLAESHLNLQQFAEAEPLLKQAHHLANRILASDHDVRLKVLGHLGGLYDHLGDAEKTEHYWTLQLEAFQLAFGQSNPQTLSSLGNLANFYREQGRLEESTILFGELIEATQGDFDGSDHLTVVTLNNLGLHYLDEKEFGKAESFLLKSLAATREFRGDNHREVLITEINLSSLYLDMERLDDAELLLTKVISTAERTLPASDPLLLTAYGNLGSVFDRSKRFADAERAWDKFVNLATKIRGATHEDTLIGLDNQANAVLQLGRIDDAEKLYLELIRRRNASLGENHGLTWKAVDDLLKLYKSSGDAQKGCRLLKVFLKRNPNNASWHQRYAWYVVDPGQPVEEMADEGLAHAERAMQLVSGQPSEEIHITLAWALFASGDGSAAMAQLTQALEDASVDGKAEIRTHLDKMIASENRTEKE
jgi:eukaryotic-like serine/threonine-protein kinase